MEASDHIATTSWSALLDAIRPALNETLWKAHQEARLRQEDSDWLPYLLLRGWIIFHGDIRHPLPQQVLNLNRRHALLPDAFFALTRRLLGQPQAPCDGVLQLQCILEGATTPCSALAIRFEVVSEHAPYRTSRPVSGMLKQERRFRKVAVKHAALATQRMIEMTGSAASVVHASASVIQSTSRLPPPTPQTSTRPSALERGLTAVARGATEALTAHFTSSGPPPAEPSAASLTPSDAPAPSPLDATTFWVWQRYCVWEGTIKDLDARVLLHRERDLVRLSLIRSTGPAHQETMAVDPNRRFRLDVGLRDWALQQAQRHLAPRKRTRLPAALEMLETRDSSESPAADSPALEIQWSEQHPFWVAHGHNPLSGAPVPLQLLWAEGSYTLLIGWPTGQWERIAGPSGPRRPPEHPGQRALQWAEEKAESRGLVQGAPREVSEASDEAFDAWDGLEE